MKVLNVSWVMDPVSGGGAAERALQMSLALKRIGVEVTLLTLDIGQVRQHIKTLGEIPVIALRCLWPRFYIPAFSYTQLRRLVHEADIVHLMGHFTLLNTIVYFLARRLRKPYVVCVTGALPVFGRSRALKQLYNRLVGCAILRQASALIAITAAERGPLEACGADPRRIVVIPNGVNPGDYPACDGASFRGQFRLGGDPFILFLGRLHLIKGPDLLLEAFAKLKDEFSRHRLVFAGPDVGIRALLEQTAAAYGLTDRVVFTGYLDRVAKNEALHAADIVAIPSRQEAMSIVVLEAGMAGKPVVITDQCGFDEIAERDAGLVVPASVEGLAAGLSRLLRDAGWRRIAGRNLRRHTLAGYTWDSLGGRFRELFDQSIASMPTTPGMAAIGIE